MVTVVGTWQKQYRSSLGHLGYYYLPVCLSACLSACLPAYLEYTYLPGTQLHMGSRHDDVNYFVVVARTLPELPGLSCALATYGV